MCFRLLFSYYLCPHARVSDSIFKLIERRVNIHLYGCFVCRLMKYEGEQKN